MDNVTDIDFGWIVGFLEGEASFGKTISRKKESTGSIYVCVAQVQLQPLEKMSKLCGGNIHKTIRDHSQGQKWSDYYRWQVCGMTAEKLMKEILPLMSPKRQAKIIELLAWAAKRPGPNHVRFKATHCRRGHPFTEGNIYLFPDGSRRNCKICAELSRQKYYAKNRIQSLTTTN